jgi:hypothetical protein
LRRSLLINPAPINYAAASIYDLTVDVAQTILTSTGQVTATTVSFNSTPPSLPSRFLHHSMKMFFDNGGDTCYLVSIGDFNAAHNPTDLRFIVKSFFDNQAFPNVSVK